MLAGISLKEIEKTQKLSQEKIITLAGPVGVKDETLKGHGM